MTWGRDKTSAAQLDSAEAQATSGKRGRKGRRGKLRIGRMEVDWNQPGDLDLFAHKRRPRPRRKGDFSLFHILWFLVAVLFLWPVFVIVAVFASLGDAVSFLRYTVEATISSTFWSGRLCKEWAASIVLDRRDPKMQRLRGERRAFGHEAVQDWKSAGRALVGIGRSWSRVFGLGGLYTSLEQRLERANQNWRRYVADAQPAQAPTEFPENYVVLDQLPPGGSSARLYVVRRRGEERNGPLYVLKYFDLTAGGNLESIVRESHAAELAKRLGLIVESSLGSRAFWYVMPFYHGQTMTKGVMDELAGERKLSPRERTDQRRKALGWVHQVLQIIAQYHEAGVFHKDIKPDNLIVNGERTYLVDIGLMTPLSSMQQLTTHGTEYFRDPEMVKLALQGREVREVNAAKFDLYSIGAVLFFAVSGEFPTSGALSRLPDDVPLAVQWVVNRAMTGMEQRYDSARAMLTDVDYLCFAASNGTLEQVKPADLPSFRGMPVPPHLLSPAQAMRTAPENTTSYREKLAAAPGGYGAWYSAPAFARGQLRAARVGMVVVGAFVALGVVGGLAAFALKHRRVEVSEAPTSALAERAEQTNPDLVPLFQDIDRQLARGVVSHQKSVEARPRVDLVPTAITRLRNTAGQFANHRKEEFAEALYGRNSDGELSWTDLRYVVASIEEDPADLELAEGLEREFQLEAARLGVTKLTVPDPEDGDLLDLKILLRSVSDEVALHREFASRYAGRGKVPPFVAVFTIEPVEDARALVIRLLFPGWEHELQFTIQE